MIAPSPDQRTSDRRAKDEQIASEPLLPPLELQTGVRPIPLEDHLARESRPIAVAGVVENGLVRPLDPNVKLAEQSRVIIVASERG
jgi:hypothetical protein